MCFLTRLSRAGWADDILSLKRANQRGTIDAKTGKLFHREFDKYSFILGTQLFDLRNVCDEKQFGANILHSIPEFAVRKTIAGTAIDDANCIAEIVVTSGTDHTHKQGMAYVANILANLVPGVGDLLGVRAALEVHKNCCDAGSCVTPQEIQMGRFLLFVFV